MTTHYKRVLVGVSGTTPTKYKLGWKRIIPASAWRTKMHQDMTWMLEHEPSIHYLQHRPFDPKAVKTRGLPIRDDCSATTTQLYYAANRPDPNGNNYNGWGNTTTIRARTPRRTSLRKMRIGDIIVYGQGLPHEHVAVVYKRGKDPVMFSHGQERGPITISHTAENDYHGGYYTLHDGGRIPYDQGTT